MKRISMDLLEQRAFVTRRCIEIDDRLGIAVLKIGRETFYASLPSTPEWVAADTVEGLQAAELGAVRLARRRPPRASTTSTPSWRRS
jgi:hypothetical protein